jgi:hypothetical protein
MATTKTTTLTFRIEPALKEALRLAADQEHRSIANMVEVMIRDHCTRMGIPIVEPGGLSGGKHSPATATAKKRVCFLMTTHITDRYTCASYLAPTPRDIGAVPRSLGPAFC